MKGIRVPKDVRKAIIKKYTIRLVCFAVIMTGFVLAIFLWENKIIDNLNTGYKIIIYTAWLAVPFLVTACVFRKLLLRRVHKGGDTDA